MTHHVFEVDDADAKKDLVEALASGTGRRILFMRTKHHAKKLAKQLTAAGIPAVDLHGNLAQAARDRNLAAFGAGDVRVLVATDVAARGVHVDDVELVVHVDPPTEHKAYLHRSGRTARAGSAGDVVTVMLPDQERDVKRCCARPRSPSRPRVTADSPAVTALVGEVAAYVKPAPKPELSRGGGPAGRERSAQARCARRSLRFEWPAAPAAPRRALRSAGSGTEGHGCRSPGCRPRKPRRQPRLRCQAAHRHTPSERIAPRVERRWLPEAHGRLGWCARTAATAAPAADSAALKGGLLRGSALSCTSFRPGSAPARLCSGPALFRPGFSSQVGSVTPTPRQRMPSPGVSRYEADFRDGWAGHPVFAPRE